MEKEELEAQVNRVLAGAKLQIEQSNDFTPLFLVHHSGEWRPFRMPPGTEVLLNRGEAKREIFGFFREFIAKVKADGVIFATDVWAATATDEGMKHYGTDEWKELQDFGFEKLLQRGWVRRVEALAITAQSETDALIVQQPYQRRSTGLELLTAKRYWVPQSNFSGRQKMFGDLRQENLGEA